ncbi:MAG: flavodoxin family protein [Oscillospiraceae bacterium]
MKTIVLYYSVGGATRKEAEKLAAERKAPLCRIETVRRHSLPGTLFFGSFRAMRRKAEAIKPLEENLAEYDEIVLGCPIWAGHPAPAFNAVIKQLPAGKQVELFFCSAGGESAKSMEGTKALVIQRGCTLLSYRDIATGATPSAHEAAAK